MAQYSIQVEMKKHYSSLLVSAAATAAATVS